MTIEELIEQLSEFNDNMQVVFYSKNKQLHLIENVELILDPEIPSNTLCLTEFDDDDEFDEDSINDILTDTIETEEDYQNSRVDF